jgi:hypothetical protein
LNLYTGSANTRFNLIEIKTGSYATTGSNTFVGNQIISGSLTISGSIFVPSGSISGSHIGNGSGLTGIVSSSYSLTSSYASVAQTLLGSVVSASYALTASYAMNGGGGPSVSASYAATASYIDSPGIFSGSFSGSYRGDGSALTGIVATANPAGPNQSIQFNDAGTTSGSSDLSFDKALRVLKLSGATSINAITSSGTVDNYLQINIQNKSNASTASSDIVATNDTGTEIGNYIDMGINGSGFNQSGLLGNANDAYIYNTGSKLIIGNITPAIHPSSSIYFVVGGPNAGQNTIMIISSSGLVSASAFAGDGSRLTGITGGTGITAGQAIAYAIALG